MPRTLPRTLPRVRDAATHVLRGSCPSFPFAAHVRRLRDAGYSWWRIITGRRVPARWVCRPLGLFAPVRPMRSDERIAGPTRTKWAGDPSRPPLSAAATAWLLLVWLGCMGCAMTLLISYQRMERSRTLVAVILTSAIFALVGRICDRGPTLGRAMVLSGPLLAALTLVLAG